MLIIIERRRSGCRVNFHRDSGHGLRISRVPIEEADIMYSMYGHAGAEIQELISLALPLSSIIRQFEKLESPKESPAYHGEYSRTVDNIWCTFNVRLLAHLVDDCHALKSLEDLHGFCSRHGAPKLQIMMPSTRLARPSADDVLTLHIRRKVHL